MKNVSGIVSLTTDFGLEDPYVGQLKGALLSTFRHATVVDLTHGIPNHDICAAAHALSASYQWFPKGTVHLAVVDPGVGTDRKILAARGKDHYFIGPDNGVLSVLLADGVIEEIRVIPSSSSESTTFHGRDIMAPAGAGLAQGGVFEEIGTLLSLEHCVRKACGKTEKRGNRIVGEVLRIDHFGNIRTSIRKQDLNELRRDMEDLIITIGDHTITGISTTYGEHRPGTLCCVIDSDGYLEIAVNQGSGAAFLQVDPDEAVRVQVSIAGSDKKTT